MARSGIAALGLLLLSSLGQATDISIKSYAITDPSGENAIVYSKVQDMTITFDVTVESAGSGGGGASDAGADNDGSGRDVTGIKVFFENTGGTLVGSETSVAGFETHTVADGQEETISGNVVTLKFGSKTECTDAESLCVEIEGDVVADSSKSCLTIGTSSDPAGAKNCAVVTIAADSFKVTGPQGILYTRTDETEIVFTLTASLSDVAISGQVDAVKVYFSQSDDDTKKSAPVSGTWQGEEPIPVDTATTPLGDITASLTMDADCVHYDQLCVEISDGIIVWDDDCIDLGTDEGQAGESDCSVLTIDDGSLKITEPPLSDITYTTAKETSITLEMTISPATGLTGQVETVNVYFSDKDETQTDPVAGTFDGTPLQVTTANTKLDGVVASVILDENCAKYTHLCVQILDGTVIEDEDCLETGTEEGQAGDVDCSGSSGLLNAVGRFSILTGVLVVMTIRWM